MIMNITIYHASAVCIIHVHNFFLFCVLILILNYLQFPIAIVANTTKGRGVSFMEDNPDFHGKAPNDHELEIAMGELS